MVPQRHSELSYERQLPYEQDSYRELAPSSYVEEWQNGGETPPILPESASMEPPVRVSGRSRKARNALPKDDNATPSSSKRRKKGGEEATPETAHRVS